MISNLIFYNDRLIITNIQTTAHITRFLPMIYNTNYTTIAYVSLIIQLFPIVPLIVVFIIEDVKENSIAYIEGIVIGFLITYLII